MTCGERIVKKKNVGGMKYGKHENPEKPPKNLDITHHNCSLDDTRLELGISVRMDERTNRS